MKPDIHPEYRPVAFRDISADFQFVSKSCVQTRDTVEIEGVEYPLVTLDISSQSHPFYTGTQKLLDAEGRVERYYKKYGFQKPPELLEEEAANAALLAKATEKASEEA